MLVGVDTTKREGTGLSTTTTGQRTSTREPYVDFLRAFSLLVVVVWHWAFTIIIWQDDGPRATSPLGFTNGLWILTWLLQVLPVFFYVGGYGHLRSWEKARERGVPLSGFVLARLRTLAIPAVSLFLVWVGIGVALGFLVDAEWIGRAVRLVVSPLWFIAVYLVMVALLPVALWLHRRFDVLVLVALAGLAGVVDILRFREGQNELALLNMVFVWGLCHQLGFFYDRIVRAPRNVGAALMFGGFFGLVLLVGSGLYPGSMVGVPGEASNMAPPTLSIVALMAFQAGVVELLRPWVTERLETRARWARVSEVINRFSLPLFLFHSTGMALHRAVSYAIAGGVNEAREPTLWWWLYRPVSVIGPLLFTLPVIFLFGRRWVRKPRSTDAGPRPGAQK